MGITLSGVISWLIAKSIMCTVGAFLIPIALLADAIDGLLKYLGVSEFWRQLCTGTCISVLVGGYIYVAATPNVAAIERESKTVGNACDSICQLPGKWLLVASPHDDNYPNQKCGLVDAWSAFGSPSSSQGCSWKNGWFSTSEPTMKGFTNADVAESCIETQRNCYELCSATILDGRQQEPQSLFELFCLACKLLKGLVKMSQRGFEIFAHVRVDFLCAIGVAALALQMFLYIVM